MNQDNFYKKLRIICLILAIICMGLSLVKKAKADDFDDHYLNDIINYLNENNYDTSIFQNETVINDILTYNTFIMLPRTSNTTNGHKDIQIIFYNYEISDDFFAFGFNDSANLNLDAFRLAPNGYFLKKITSYSNYNNFHVSHIVCNYNNGGCWYGRKNYSNKFSTTIQGVEYYSVSVSNNNTIETNNYTTFSDTQYKHNIDIGYSNRKLFRVYRSASNIRIYNLDDYINLFEKSQNNNTDGFKVFKSTRSGRDYLIFDGLNAVPVNIRNGNWYLTDLTSTLGFSVTTETGSYQYSYTFDIDDASEEFPYNGTYFKWQDQWSNLYLRWEIPIDELNLPDDAYGFTENVIMTVSNNVSVNNVNVPYLGQFVYLSPVYLYGTQAESGLIDPESAPAPVIPENPINQESRNKNYQSLVYGTLLNKSGLEFEEWKQDLQSGIIWYEVLVTQAPSLQDLINDFPNFSTSDIEKLVFGCTDKEEFENDMETDLQKNSFSQYIDYVVYIYNGSDAYHSSKFDYYIFETSKGREKAISFLLDTNNTYFDKQFDILKDSIPYMKASIDRIDTNLFNLGEDIFSQNNSIIANLISIDNKFNDLEDLLKDFLNKILVALQSINIDIPAADYSSITSRLDQIISNQGNGNLNNDWYDDYRSWLYGKDATDDIISPHEFFIEVFVPIKNTYDAFVNNNAITGYVADMDLFVEYLSGKIEDNLSIYFKDGIGSAQFDINDNTMLTAGGT